MTDESQRDTSAGSSLPFEVTPDDTGTLRADAVSKCVPCTAHYILIFLRFSPTLKWPKLCQVAPLSYLMLGYDVLCVCMFVCMSEQFLNRTLAYKRPFQCRSHFKNDNMKTR